MHNKHNKIHSADYGAYSEHNNMNGKTQKEVTFADDARHDEN